MKKLLYGVYCVIITLNCVRCDSYIDAYKQSQNEKLDAAITKGDKKLDLIDREFNTDPYPYPPQNYGPPATQYESHYPPSPGPVYGPPNPPPPPPPPPPPQPAYGPPMYGPPPPIYGVPPSSVQVFYGMPHALNSFWEKLKFKLDLFTIGKILLKLVLFKKFVSWVAVICLLFFLPSLKNKFESATNGGGGERKFHVDGKLGYEELNQLFHSIYKSLENYSDDYQNYNEDNQEYHSR